MLKDAYLEVEKRVYQVAKQMGASITNSYHCFGKEKYPDAISLYFELRFCEVKRKIRISNHVEQHKNEPGQKDVKSMTIYKKIKLDAVERFVRNRINEMKKATLFIAFKKIEKQARNYPTLPSIA